MLVFYRALVEAPVHEGLGVLQDRLGICRGSRVQFHDDGEPLAKLVLQMLRPAQTSELAVNHDGQPITEGFALFHAEKYGGYIFKYYSVASLGIASPVGCEDYRLPVLLDFIDDAPQLPPRSGIHAGARLVKENDCRVAHEGLRDVQFPLIASAVGSTSPVSVLKKNLELAYQNKGFISVREIGSIIIRQ